MRCICIVDCYASGPLLVEECRRRGLATIHVQSTDPIPPFYAKAFRESDHAANIIFDGDYEACARRIAEHRPLCVIPGAEGGVPLADKLSELMGFPTNGSALSTARRDKMAMQQRVQDQGVRGIPSHRVREWSAVEPLVAAYPTLILKPASSACTDNVWKCSTPSDARAAFDSILRAVDMFAQPNREVIVQPFINEDEYIVNTASCAGHHAVLSVWKVEKIRGAHTLYDNIRLQPATGDLPRAIHEFAFSVMDALNIRWGAAHTELFWSAEGGRLIELGARLGGQKGSLLVEAATGRSVVAATLDAYLSPERFFATYMSPYTINVQACRVEMVSPATGTLTALPRLDEVRSLPSFRELSLPKPGDPIRKTIDLATCPGFVDLLHGDHAVIERDRARIRALEADGFYVIDS